LNLIWKERPKDAISVIGSRGKLRTRIRGGGSRPSAEGEVLLIRRYGTKFLWMTTGEKVRFMRCARWAAVRVKLNVGRDGMGPLSQQKKGWGGDGDRLGAPYEL